MGSPGNWSLILVLIFLNKAKAVLVSSSFWDDLDINHNYTSWVGAIATVWKYIGVDIYGFAYTKEFKFDSVLKHIKGELLWISFL